MEVRAKYPGPVTRRPSHTPSIAELPAGAEKRSDAKLPSGGLVFGLGQTAWGTFVLARGWLAVRHRLPRDLMAFLADAHEQRGVLRQVGAVYQFRHLELQRRLASR